MNRILGLGALLASLAAAPAMNAATITYDLTVNGCSGSGGCGTGTFGTIQLTDNGLTGSAAAVNVVLTLTQAGERFAGSGAGDALEFNVAGTVTITAITSGFAVGPAPDTASTFGSFSHSVTCTTCQGGQAGNPSGPLSFTVGSSSGVTISSFTGNPTYFFASDIVGNGNTGNVGALGTTTSTTPEPTTLSMLGAGLLGLGFIRSRVRK